ncbi:hypothetical protein BKA61DRAFT_361617 [Leptodontidium sp. MPI-SDFR-AT-0119]|nr:hypothetical protein BKA61DRAFT_361617 [Leptodontidium sp. MPI-SDFR-AT-0119]
MYAPCPPRRKLTNITRGRSGCDGCRRRKKRCDESKPDCAACRRLGKRCEWPSRRLKFCTDILSQNGDQNKTVRVVSSQESGIGSISESLDVPTGREPSVDNFPTPDDEHSEYFTSNSDGMDLAWNYQLRDEYTRLSSVPVPLMGSVDIWDNFWNSDTFFDNVSRDSEQILSGQGQVAVALPSESDDSNILEQPLSTLSYLVAYQLSPPYYPFIDDGLVVHVPGQDASSSSHAETTRTSRPDGNPNHIQEGTEDTTARISGSQEALYFRHWNSNVRHLLPSIFHDMASQPIQRPCFKSALLALAACNIAQCHPDVQKLALHEGDQEDVLGGEDHQQHSRLLYSAAICDFSRMEFIKENALDMLATLILFAYIELDIGSFRGLDFHLNGAERLLSDECAICLETPVGRQLVSAWLGLRIRSWRHKIPFTAPGFQKDLVAMGIDFKQIFKEGNARGHAVVAILVESLRLSDMILFERLAGRGDLDTVSSRCMQDYLQKINRPSSTEPWRPRDPVQDEDYRLLLLEQEADLDAWHTSLPVSDLPVESFDRSRVLGPDLFGGDINSQPPLRFRTHHCAMNYAYYTCARIAQSSDLLAQFLPNDTSSTNLEAGKLHPWLQILLRIVSGLDNMDCIRYNVYTIGITDLLFSCALRCPSSYPVIRKCLDRLIQRFKGIGMSREGVNTLHFLEVPLTTLEQEKDQGRDVFFLITGKTADAEFNQPSKNQKDHPCVVYGRDHISQKMYSRRLEKPATAS